MWTMVHEIREHVHSCTYNAVQEKLALFAKCLRELEGHGEHEGNVVDSAHSNGASADPSRRDADAYRRDAIRNVSTCFRCCELWSDDAHVETVNFNFALRADIYQVAILVDHAKEDHCNFACPLLFLTIWSTHNDEEY
jgi:hypothetical protein